MSDRRLYTPEELDRALALKEQGLTWPVIASRLGRSTVALKANVCRYRKGALGFRYVRWQERNSAMFAAAERGLPVRDIAEAHGMTVAAAYRRLGYHGYDGEVRSEYREAARESAGSGARP